jgi:threonine/homoserine/homoserine lactone efflux protein
MLSNLLATYATWTAMFNAWGENYTWMAQIFNVITIVMYVIMGLVGAGGAIYAIYLGIQLARAEDQSKRDDAKKHLITVFIAVAVTVVLVLFFNNLLPLIVSSFVTPPTM